jgi:hypothetical protein
VQSELGHNRMLGWPVANSRHTSAASAVPKPYKIQALTLEDLPVSVQATVGANCGCQGCLLLFCLSMMGLIGVCTAPVRTSTVYPLHYCYRARTLL